MSIEKVTDIERSESNNLTENQLKVVIACKLLNIGFNSFQGGEKLSSWLEKHSEKVEDIFGDLNRLYIRMKNPKSSMELAQFVVKEKIGDELQWKKCKGSDRWWLLVWWGD